MRAAGLKKETVPLITAQRIVYSLTVTRAKNALKNNASTNCANAAGCHDGHSLPESISGLNSLFEFTLEYLSR